MKGSMKLSRNEGSSWCPLKYVGGRAREELSSGKLVTHAGPLRIPRSAVMRVCIAVRVATATGSGFELDLGEAKALQMAGSTREGERGRKAGVKW